MPTLQRLTEVALLTHSTLVVEPADMQFDNHHTRKFDHEERLDIPCRKFRASEATMPNTYWHQ
jgi:hypothetical protein